LDKLTKANVELSDVITVILDWIGIISEEDGIFISNYLHTIRDQITFTMGTMIGTEDALNVAHVEAEIEQLADQIFNEYRLRISLSIDLKLWMASENLDLALYYMAADNDELVDIYINLCIQNLENAKEVIIQLKDKGDLSGEEAQILVEHIEEFIYDLSIF